MFGDHFYHELTRKYIVLFGNMFNNITLLRVNSETGNEIERFKVPVVYGPKEKYVTRLEQDPDLTKALQVSLPRMSFEINSFSYDASRKQNSLYRAARANTSTGADATYMGVPYNLGFELNLYSRNIDDGNQIIEQILPYFNPDYTPTINNLPEIGIVKDVPIILDSVSNHIQYEGNFDSIRYVYWTLTFTMQVYYFGPVVDTSLIRKVITNFYNDSSLVAGYIVRINTASGNNGDYTPEDIVYQGNNYNTANAYGTILSWSNVTGKLVVGGVQGTFRTGSTIRAVSTNAAYSLSSFEAAPLKLVTITIEPDPITANANSDYGYTTTIAEQAF